MTGFDCNQKIDDTAFKFKEVGFDFVFRYVGREQMSSFDIDSKEVKAILDAGLKLGIVQHCPNDGWIPTGELGTHWGQNAVTFCEATGYKEGCIVYLDLEGIKTGTPIPQILAYCNNWYDQVVAKYMPGVYIGFDSYLTSSQLFRCLKFQHYWKSLSSVPDVESRGYEMKQFAGGITLGVDYDRNEICGDYKGNSPILMEPSEDWQHQACRWLYNYGYTSILHDPSAPVTMAILGQVLENYDKKNKGVK